MSYREVFKMPQWVVVAAARYGNKWHTIDGECAIVTAENSEKALEGFLDGNFNGDDPTSEQWLVLPLFGAEIFSIVPKAAYEIQCQSVILETKPKRPLKERKT
jgi:hypothetical protein